MGRSLEAKPIKSAQRVFEVLEFFDADRQEASVMDIARRYGYPQSSASELLGYMVSLGYLRRGENGRTYRLSVRVAMLGAWVQPQLVRQGRLLPLMDDLAVETGATVVLAANVGVRLQCLHVVYRDGAACGPRQGDLLHLLHSAEGRALLLRCDRQLVRKYVHRLNAETETEKDRVRYDDLAAALDEGSASGFVRVVSGDAQSISILIPHADPREQLALTLHAPSFENEEMLVRKLRNAVSTHLGLGTVESAADPAPRLMARSA